MRTACSAVLRLTLLERRVTIEGQFPQNGPVAQLGARMNGIHEVTGSIPVWSTTPSFSVLISRK